MSVGERIKAVRKTLGLTQAEFAARISSTQNTITRYETGNRSPSSTVLAMIGQTYGINLEWLRTGVGEMFLPKTTDTLRALAREHGLSHNACIAIEKLLNVEPEVLEGLVSYCMEVAAALNAEKIPDSPVSHGVAIVEADSIAAQSPKNGTKLSP